MQMTLTSTPDIERSVDRVHGVTAMGADGQVDKKALVIPPGYWDLFDPFLMLAEDWFSTPGFSWHPHRGIETVTVVLDGALEHGDSHGNSGVLTPGDIQWMTAGAGIVHRELAYRNEFVHSLQLWVNLPSTAKMVDSRYQDLRADTLTPVVGDGASVQLISGHHGELAGPAENHHPVTGMHLTVEPGRALDVPLPADQRAFVYLLAGRLVAGVEGTPLEAGEVAWSDPVDGTTSTLHLEAPEGDAPAAAILFSGRPLGEPVVARGPFVMNTAQEIEDAYRDFRAGRFGPIPNLTRLP